MNLVKEMNKCESEFLTKILGKYIEVSDTVYENYIQDIEREFQELYMILNKHYSSHAVEYVRYRFFRNVIKIKYFSSLVREELRKNTSDSGIIFDAYQKELQGFITNVKEHNIVKKKITISIHKSYRLQDEILRDMMSNMNFLVEEVISKLQEYKPEEYIKFERIKEEISVSIDLKNIFSYKDMEDLAMDNEYSYERQTGDHMIYKHAISNRIVVIPAHNLTKSLSYEIQKQIYTRKGV